ncbi:MAG TPA: Zn-ribbon domain-containing OB-fold protein [Chloroflexota bacterium]|nr:Zn-ribbon domain-containing OB-fold protein [Chloroflexota bacterium]
MSRSTDSQLGGASLRALPQPDPVTQPYWDSLRRHALQLQRCNACGRFVFYPRAACPACLNGTLEWVPASGRGTLYTYTIVHRAPSPEFQAQTPYIVALVDLEEGVRLLTTLVNVPPDPDQVNIGMPLEIVYDDLNLEITLPRFRPIGRS